jgi:hypothetical protein
MNHEGHEEHKEYTSDFVLFVPFVVNKNLLQLAEE